MKNLIIVGLAVGFILLAGHALADMTYLCTNGAQERIISVIYLEEGQQVPCEVQYRKEGVTETLWDARNEAGYCEERAREFVEKQRQWGWLCEETDAGS